MMEVTPPQTIGPFFHDCLLGRPWHGALSTKGAASDMMVAGRLLDGNGDPVADGVIEIWYADRNGGYASRSEQSGEIPERFARAATDEGGAFAFAIRKPGRVRLASGNLQAPHLNVVVFARGLLDRLVTRIYFDGDAANDADPVLAEVSAERRRTLVASRRAGAAETYHWDLVLQGSDETVFFDA